MGYQDDEPAMGWHAFLHVVPNISVDPIKAQESPDEMMTVEIAQSNLVAKPLDLDAEDLAGECICLI